MGYTEHNIRVRLGVYALAAACVCTPVEAAKVVLRIRAGNPIEKAQPVRIRSNLPRGITTNDIVTLGGLELGYDIKADLYYVHGEVTLGPKETRVYDVELNDIWQIQETELAGLREHTDKLSAILAGTPSGETATALAAEIKRTLAAIEEHQVKNAVGVVTRTIQHIQAHDANLESLARVRRDVGKLENLALAARMDPGRLLGEDPSGGAPDRIVELAPEEYKTAVVRITVRNTSPNAVRTTDVYRALPPEIRPADVLDAGGLDVAFDAAGALTYLAKRGVEIGTNAAVTFEVRIRDKWDVHAPRMVRLREEAGELLQRISAREKFDSVVAMVRELLAELDTVAARTGPEALSPEYVAFHRGLSQDLDEIEQRLNRIRAALRPIEKTTRLGFDAKPPSTKSTWMIIYVILGFMALVSLLFFLRWFGKTKADDLASVVNREEGGGR